MRRAVINGTLFLLLGVEAWGAGPPPPPARIPEAGTTASTPQRRNAGLEKRLRRVVSFPGIKDRGTTLSEALARLAVAYGLSFEINEGAFKYEHLHAPARTLVVRDKPIAPLKAPVAAVVQRILDRVPVPSGATWVVRRDVIEITTGTFATAEKVAPLLKERAGPPVRGKTSWGEWLLQEINFAGYDDPKTTLLEALDQLAKIYDLQFEINERAFTLEDVENVAKTHIAQDSPVPAAKATLATVLRRILLRVPARSGATWLIRRDVIEITTGAAAHWEVTRGRGPIPAALKKGDNVLAFPLVNLRPRPRPLDETLNLLAEQVSFNLVLDCRLGEKGKVNVTLELLNTPLDTALVLLTELADLDFVRLDNVFFVTTKERARSLRARWEKHRPAKGAEEPEASPPKKGVRPKKAPG
jgi:hypothetical protein